METETTDFSLVPARKGDFIRMSENPVGQVTINSPCAVHYRSLHSTEDAPTEDRQSFLTGSQDVRTEAGSQVLKVRFDLDYTEKDTLIVDWHGSEKSVSIFEHVTDDPPKNSTKSTSCTFRDLFRTHSKRKNKSSREDLERRNTALDENAQLTAQMNTSISGDSLSDVIARDSSNVVNDFELDSLDERLLWSKFRYTNYRFQCSQSTKSRLKSLPEDDEVEGKDLAHSDSEGHFLHGGPSSMLMYPSLLTTRCGWFSRQQYIMAGSDRFTEGRFYHVSHNKNHSSDDVEHDLSYRQKQDKTTTGNYNYHHSTITGILKHITDLFGHTHGAKSSQYAHSFTSTDKSPSQRLIRHSLASVELGSWAARGARRGSALPPFCASLVPTEASSRTEILQAVSSAIIHLFQRKPLKENELGLLQEHVRFLINSEAGGLVHEYYKDQLLRKGMIILREKIKNEQGLELLKQLSETWQYFFKEILPTLQAILYPLAGLLAKDETARSLSLLAFRNIVVLKVSLKEALDSVEKHFYPPSIQQMLLVLQSIQDNVFLSENQFILEKLVARVVCPYLGQRGVYEGSPDPVIRVKPKPLPIPILLVPDSRLSEHRITSPSSLSPWRGNHDNSIIKKLKPVLEHVHDGGRRHSIMS